MWLRVERWGCGLASAGIMLIHALERYNRHVADREPFLEFN